MPREPCMILEGPCPEAPPDAAPDIRDWLSLPHQLLATILQPQATGFHQPVRLVCRQFRDTVNEYRATLRLQQLFYCQRENEQPAMLPIPPRARVVRLDASGLKARSSINPQSTAFVEWLVTALQAVTWPAAEISNGGTGTCASTAALPRACASVVELQLNHIEWPGEEDVQRVLDVTLCSPTFAPGGLQVLDINQGAGLHGAGARALAAALPAAPQLSALRELALAHAGMRAEDAAVLCSALEAATHITGLTLLDLSGNPLRPEGITMLAGCLRSARHLSSLQRLMLSWTAMLNTGAASELAGAVAAAGLRLTSLAVDHNSFFDEGAAAWASTLKASKFLAGLQVLDISDNGITGKGVARFAAALQAATHLTALRRLVLLPNQDAEPALLTALLAAAPHLAASLECLSLQRLKLGAPAAMDAVAAPLLAGLQLPRLTSLVLCGCSIECVDAVSSMCAMLRAATQLSGLQELDLSHNKFLNRKEGCVALAAGLAAATHLSRLRTLRLCPFEQLYWLGSSLAAPERVANLLHAAPHLRGLTAATFMFRRVTGTRLAGLHDALELLPHLKSLSISAISAQQPRHSDLRKLLTALQKAPRTEQLEELSLSLGSEVAVARVAVLASWLRACTCLCGLRRMMISLFPADAASFDVLGEALAAASHLSSLQELSLQTDLTMQDAWRTLQQQLAASALQGVAIRIYHY